MINFRYAPSRNKCLVLDSLLWNSLVEQSDVITINTPLTPETDGMFDRNLIFRMKKGAYLVNTAEREDCRYRQHLLKLWKWVIWLDMPVTFGTHSQLQRTIHGDICLIMQWYLIIPERHWKPKRDIQME